MSETVEHRQLIDVIKDYVHARFPFIEEGEFYVDGTDCKPPPMIDGSIPDFYCESHGYVIIGEAKTKDDIINEHTEKQFGSYLIRASSAEKNDDLTPIIIYSVPNNSLRHAKNYLRSLKNKDYDNVELCVKSPLELCVDKNESKSKQRIHIKREPPIETKIEAFDYQKKAFSFVKDLEYAAIFHEQGLGKTKIAMDTIVYWIKENIVDTVLVVTKKSLLYNWVEEFDKHTTLKPKMLSTKRGSNYYAFNGAYRVILTNFEIVVSERERLELFLKSRYVGIVIDESAKIKNPKSRLTKAFLDLSPLFKRRLIMTGTPVANRPYDIWSQIFFLDQGASLGTDFQKFQSETDLSNKLYVDERDQKEFSDSISSIFEKINTFSIRETKNSGIIKLPPKEYYSIDVPFEYSQKQMYDRIRRAEASEIIQNGSVVIDDVSSIIKRLTRLIEVTSNPRLIDESYQFVPEKLKVTKSLVREIVERDEKVIVWTMFLKNVELIKKHLSEFSPVVISGKMSIEDRNVSVSKFKKDPEVKVLIATNAAKEGLTLTVANNAIFYDRSLSLDDYLQAQDRIHRISQTETCNIYNLKVTGSIDEWIDALLASKALAAKVVQGDISQKEYDDTMDYSFGQIIENILGEN